MAVGGAAPLRGGEVAWSGVGCQLGAYEVAVAYAREREQFGKPIGEFQGLQFLLADLGAAVERARGRPGIGDARRVAAFADGRSESAGESHSRVVLHRPGNRAAAGAGPSMRTAASLAVKVSPGPSCRTQRRRRRRRRRGGGMQPRDF